jgi:hypothetical protein
MNKSSTSFVGFVGFVVVVGSQQVESPNYGHQLVLVKRWLSFPVLA